MAAMVSDRGGKMYGMDDRYAAANTQQHTQVLRKQEKLMRSRRYCIDNGAMIAHTGLLMYRSGYRMPLEDAYCTQRCTRVRTNGKALNTVLQV